MKTLLAALAAVVLFTGCSTPNTLVKIDSDPPGARVFLAMGVLNRPAKSRSYLGTTPCTASIATLRSGCFKLPEIAFASAYVASSATFIAEPPSGAPGQFPQSVTYRGETSYVGGDKVPTGVFFDMHKQP